MSFNNRHNSKKRFHAHCSACNRAVTTVIPNDHPDKWLRCRDCGSVVPATKRTAPSQMEVGNDTPTRGHD